MVLRPSRIRPQLKEWIGAALPQWRVERQALLEQGAGCDSITLLEMQQSQTIERPGDPLLEACHPGMFEALLEQRAHPRIRALIGVREEGERKAYEWVDEAGFVASSLLQGPRFPA